MPCSCSTETDPVFLPFKVTSDDLTPTKAHQDDAGWDLRAAEDLTIPAGSFLAVPTGIVAAVPSGFCLDIRPRSGLAYKHGVTVLNSPGTVDAGYHGEIKVILINHGRGNFAISRGDRIAQCLITRLVPTDWYTGWFQAASTRGEGGFGSSGAR